MAKVTFLPTKSAVEVPEGTALLDAAREAKVSLDAPCGGDGTCGECRVRVTEGAVDFVSRSYLTAEEIAAGWVLACSSRISGDLTVIVDTEPRQDAAGAILTESRGETLAPGTVHASPRIQKVALQVEEPSLEHSFSDLERLQRALSGAGGPSAPTCGLPLLRQLGGILRSAGHQVTATVVVSDCATSPERATAPEGTREGALIRLDQAPEDPREGELIRLDQAQEGPREGALIRLDPGDTSDLCVGLAVDIGTTTCAVQLVDLITGRILNTRAAYNEQRARGLDVISRINYARSPDHLEELRLMVLRTLNDLIEQLCAEGGIKAADLVAATIAGNCSMYHLLLGLDPDQVRLSPFSPVVNHPPDLTAEAVGLAIYPHALVSFAPGVGSYVGGDITAGLLSTPLARSDEEGVSLFLDIGTNGEVVVGNSSWLMACAASAGPAFEGSGVGCGMRASAGAIERVRICPQTGRAEVAVIGGGRPRGLCGSGLIDLLAELWTGGFCDPSGKLVWDRCPPDRLRVADAAAGARTCPGFIIVPEGSTQTGEAIVIDEHDLQHLIRTKAAIYSACSFLLGSVGLEMSVVSRVLVAGGFGRYLDFERSIQVGMLPDLPRDRFVYVGNSSLAGAVATLVSAHARAKVSELADRITYMELSADPAYMDEYIGALFLPHTDRSRFPSVKSC